MELALELVIEAELKALYTILCYLK